MISKKPIKAQCKNCGYKIEIPFRRITNDGSSKKCPQCGRMIQVPAFWELK